MPQHAPRPCYRKYFPATGNRTNLQWASFGKKPDAVFDFGNTISPNRKQGTLPAYTKKIGAERKAFRCGRFFCAEERGKRDAPFKIAWIVFRKTKTVTCKAILLRVLGPSIEKLLPSHFRQVQLVHCQGANWDSHRRGTAPLKILFPAQIIFTP